MVSITHLLNRTASHQRRTLTDDGQGGTSEVISEIQEIKGRRNPAGPRDRELAGREEAEVTHIWYFDTDIGAKPRDILISNGVQDEVLASLPPSQPDFLKVAVKEIQLGQTT